MEPNNISALRNKGTVLGLLRQFDEAISYLDKVLEIDPKDQVAVATRIAIISEGYLEPLNIENFTRMAINGQFSIRDSHGNLVAYIESERISLSHLGHLSDLIANYMNGGWNDSDPDNLATLSITSKNITKNGKSLEWVTIHHSGTYLGPNLVASKTALYSPALNFKWYWLLSAYHDGYPITYGDKFDLLWNIFRPIG